MQNKEPENKNTQQKSAKEDLLLALVSYFSPLGWVLAYIIYFDENKKTAFNAFHLRQSLGVSISAIIIFTGVWIISVILNFIYLPSLGKIVSYIAYLIIFTFYILGVLSAANGERRKLPIVGDYFQNVFKSIK